MQNMGLERRENKKEDIVNHTMILQKEKKGKEIQVPQRATA
jgi:hypothetical protein